MFEFIGALAACLTTLSFIPQVVQIMRTKNTESISLYMYLVFITGVFCWLIYGIHLGSFQMIIANVITFILAGMILSLKINGVLKNRRK